MLRFILKNNYLKILKYFILVVLSFYAIIIFIIFFDGINNDSITTQNKILIGVIYGNKVEKNGLPSARLIARLDAGKELYNDGIIKKIIVSGGTGEEGFDEAKVMKNYLVLNGVNTNDIVEDNKGNNTIATSLNLKKILNYNYNNINDIGIVGISQFYHIFRIKFILSTLGYANIYGYSPKYYDLRDFYSLFREGLIILKYLVFHDE